MISFLNKALWSIAIERQHLLSLPVDSILAGHSQDIRAPLPIAGDPVAFRDGAWRPLVTSGRHR